MYRDGRGTEKDPIAAYMWFQIAETTSRRRLQACVNSGKRLASELAAVELAEARRRASEWLKLNSSELASGEPVLRREPIPTTSKLTSDKRVIRRKRFPNPAA